MSTTMNMDLTSPTWPFSSLISTNNSIVPTDRVRRFIALPPSTHSFLTIIPSKYAFMTKALLYFSLDSYSPRLKEIADLDD
ncbi:conserved hypothetical protein [Ricinus communis]|uniref:Uncharacterized protein n=1 Tax=Ricinus communis TaxID=3988 RepID=B9REN8_RICCO|nr:conserved hypothetical protein [Ricinus communis]